MAAVMGPLMSLDASGTVAGAIVFSKWKGRSYVRRHAIPANPQSGMQVSMRAMMRFLAQYWGDLPIVETTWLPGATSLKISSFNNYIRENMVRWRQWKCPSTTYPASETGAAPSAPTTTVTSGVHSCSLSIADGATAPDQGWVIHRSLSMGFTPSLSTVIAVIPRVATPTVFVDHPLTGGITVYYRIGGFRATGLMGTLEAEKTGGPS